MSEGSFNMLNVVCEAAEVIHSLMQRREYDITDEHSKEECVGTSPESQALRSVAGVQP